MKRHFLLVALIGILTFGQVFSYAEVSQFDANSRTLDSAQDNSTNAEKSLFKAKDTNAPKLIQSSMINAHEIVLKFDEALEAKSTRDLSHYKVRSLYGSKSNFRIYDTHYNKTEYTITLWIESTPPSSLLVIEVEGIQDRFGNRIIDAVRTNIVSKSDSSDHLAIVSAGFSNEYNLQLNFNMAVEAIKKNQFRLMSNGELIAVKSVQLSQSGKVVNLRLKKAVTAMPISTFDIQAQKLISKEGKSFAGNQFYFTVFSNQSEANVFDVLPLMKSAQMVGAHQLQLEFEDELSRKMATELGHYSVNEKFGSKRTIRIFEANVNVNEKRVTLWIENVPSGMLLEVNIDQNKSVLDSEHPRNSLAFVGIGESSDDLTVIDSVMLNDTMIQVELNKPVSKVKAKQFEVILDNHKVEIVSVKVEESKPFIVLVLEKPVTIEPVKDLTVKLNRLESIDGAHFATNSYYTALKTDKRLVEKPVVSLMPLVTKATMSKAHVIMLTFDSAFNPVDGLDVGRYEVKEKFGMKRSFRVYEAISNPNNNSVELWVENMPSSSLLDVVVDSKYIDPALPNPIKNMTSFVSITEDSTSLAIESAEFINDRSIRITLNKQITTVSKEMMELLIGPDQLLIKDISIDEQGNKLTINLEKPLEMVPVKSIIIKASHLAATDGSQFVTDYYYWTVKTDQMVTEKPLDTIAPEVVNIKAINPNMAEIIFSESLSSNSAIEASNYQIMGLSILGITYDDDAHKVTLKTSDQKGQMYMVSMSNLVDLSGNTIQSGLMKPFVGIPAELPFVEATAAFAINRSQIKIIFNKTIDNSISINSGTNLDNYKLFGSDLSDPVTGQLVTGTLATVNGNEVVLTFPNDSSSEPGTVYTLEVSNINGLDGSKYGEVSTKLSLAASSLYRSKLTLNAVVSTNLNTLRLIFSENISGIIDETKFVVYHSTDDVPPNGIGNPVATGLLGQAIIKENELILTLNQNLDKNKSYVIDILDYNGIKDQTGVLDLKIDTGMRQPEGEFVTPVLAD